MDWNKINKGKRPPKLSREQARKRRDFSWLELLGGDENDRVAIINWEFGQNTSATEAIVIWQKP